MNPSKCSCCRSNSPCSRLFISWSIWDSVSNLADGNQPWQVQQNCNKCIEREIEVEQPHHHRRTERDKERATTADAERDTTASRLSL
ncbi:unnamed protein product [Trichogramma brassicae]|uniref:Uncharacterized protein n=1 Tax=Trichogramma brassicae TaxID=86971 RepID=A0A6H5IXG3_9HYME|nr:unnamed protein product [Trichogramma brassicae]